MLVAFAQARVDVVASPFKAFLGKRDAHLLCGSRAIEMIEFEHSSVLQFRRPCDFGR